MGLDWTKLLEPYQDSPTGGGRNIGAIRMMLLREENVPDAVNLAIAIVGRRLLAGETYENGPALVAAIKAKAREITQEAHRRMHELFEEGQDSLALQKNAEAIFEQYAVADEAAEWLMAWKATARSLEGEARYAYQKADDEREGRLALIRERKLFLEAPLWARLWWAFRGRLG